MLWVVSSPGLGGTQRCEIVDENVVLMPVDIVIKLVTANVIENVAANFGLSTNAPENIMKGDLEILQEKRVDVRSPHLLIPLRGLIEDVVGSRCGRVAVGELGGNGWYHLKEGVGLVLAPGKETFVAYETVLPKHSFTMVSKMARVVSSTVSSHPRSRFISRFIRLMRRALNIPWVIVDQSLLEYVSLQVVFEAIMKAVINT
jgi:hypothetical protein